MLNTSTVKQALKVDIAISAPMAEALQTWSLMYQNMASWLNADVKSLNLPASIAGEIARSVTIEMKAEITGSPRADYLALQFARVLPKLREKTEQGAAKGGLMIKPYIDGQKTDEIDNRKIAVDYVQADCFYPVAFDANGNITSCIFADQRTVGDKFYTRLEYHKMTAAGCEIINQAFKSTNRDSLGNQCPLTDVDDWAELLPLATITGIDKPLFAYFKYPLANNIDPNSPLGVSCYARAVDLIQEADIRWSQLSWEFESGKRAIFVDPLAFGKDANGKSRIPDKRLFRTVEGMGGGSAIGDGSGEDMFHDWTPEFREASIKSGLDAILKRIEYACGLAYGTLSDPSVEAKTATEVATTKQRTFATITDTQKALQATLEQLIWAMDIWATIGNLAPRGTFVTTYDWDDSIIVDSDVQIIQDRQTVTMGAMPKYIFLMRNYHLDEVTAKKWIADNTAEQPADMFGQGATAQ